MNPEDIIQDMYTMIFKRSDGDRDHDIWLLKSKAVSQSKKRNDTRKDKRFARSIRRGEELPHTLVITKNYPRAELAFDVWLYKLSLTLSQC